MWGSAAALGLLVATLARAPQTDLVELARDWLPAAYIIAAYYVTGLFVDQRPANSR